jgi:single-stranded-DNA-specific exonuclease
MGLIGDMAEDAGFPELEAAQKRYGKTALRNAVSLVNAPRRTASADATPALALLLKCDSPKELLSGQHPETAELFAAKEEVKAAMDEAKRVAPKVRGDVALIPLDSPCQIHPLIAQQWRMRLRDKVVIAANKAYRPGWVHFAARTGAGHDLIRFFAERRPDGAGTEYGSGHKAASGGALPVPIWNAFVTDLGFPEEAIA